MLDLILPLLAVVLAGVASAFAYQATAYTRQSVPKRIVDGVEDLKRRVLAAEEIVALHETRSIQWRQQMDGILEAVEDALERVERKRRSTAAAASKIKAQNGGEAPQSLEAEIARRAREQGLW
jgi:hypothetical protein